ncbi:MAG: ABC transporter permease [Candidatus Helarchaeales archaeon]
MQDQLESIKLRILKAFRFIEKKLSSRKVSRIADIVAIIAFVGIILVPILYIFCYVFLNGNEILYNVFFHPISGPTRFFDMLIALERSFMIAGIVVIFDLLIGLPMAVILARGEFKGKKILDTIVDLPLAVPTAALGFSVFLFWGTDSGIGWFFGGQALLPEGFFMIVLAHVIFTYPYIVRNLKVVILNIDKNLEDAAQSLGAQKFTIFRTITGPLMKEGLIAGSILAFTRSLGETGATLIVYGVFETAPIQIVKAKSLGLFGSAAFLTMLLVLTSIGLLILIKLMTRRVGLPIQTVWVKPEKILSNKYLKYVRNIMIFIFFAVIIIIPALFIIPYLFENWGLAINQVFIDSNKWAFLLVSLSNSLVIASITVVITLLIGIPMAYIIVRRNWGKFNAVLDTLVDIPLVIPSAALGFSVFLFWGTLGPFGVLAQSKFWPLNPGFFLITLVHVIFCFPYMVRVLIAVISGMPRGFEDASRTLGASSFTSFRKVTLPLIKNGILAGSIMVFTRSLGETGATYVVMGMERTIPVMIVDWVESLDFAAAAFASFILIILSFILILTLRYITGKETSIN